jgi:apolipoprotein D and lipocalin family protein
MLSRLFRKDAKGKELEVVSSVDVEKYTGTWYEIAAYLNRAQRNCTCTKAEYTLTDKGYVAIRNTCERKGKLTGISGKAFVVPNSNNAKLKVQIFWPLKADYWVIDLASDYSYAAVSTPNRKNLWILSRTPKLEERTYQEILGRVKAKGLDINRLVRTIQRCPDQKKEKAEPSTESAALTAVE